MNANGVVLLGLVLDQVGYTLGFGDSIIYKK